MSFLRELGSFYARIARTYLSWSPTLIALALFVFIPLGLLDAFTSTTDVQSLNIDSAIKVAALVGLIGALATTSLLGEVFYSGAIAISLTHPADQPAPSLRQIARQVDYRRLILVDIAYVALVVIGLFLLVVPGVLAFVWLALAGPVVEIEKRGVRESLRRSYQLVRGRFWFVFLLLAPIELVGDSIGEGLAHFVHDALGDTFVANWMAESLANVVLSPVFAIAAVLLTLDRIAAVDGSAPALNARPRASSDPDPAAVKA